MPMVSYYWDAASEGMISGYSGAVRDLV
jgi:hypothetical protein